MRSRHRAQPPSIPPLSLTTRATTSAQRSFRPKRRCDQRRSWLLLAEAKRGEGGVTRSRVAGVSSGAVAMRRSLVIDALAWRRASLLIIGARSL
jgi:hypothetical protein